MKSKWTYYKINSFNDYKYYRWDGHNLQASHNFKSWVYRYYIPQTFRELEDFKMTDEEVFLLLL